MSPHEVARALPPLSDEQVARVAALLNLCPQEVTPCEGVG